MGHASVNMTFNTYINTTPEQCKQEMEKFNLAMKSMMV